MTPRQREKLVRFINDEALAEAVYSLVQKAYLKKKDGEDTTIKAARFIALNLLDEAWRELDKYKTDSSDTAAKGTPHV